MAHPSVSWSVRAAIGLCRRVCVIMAIRSENNALSASCRRCREVAPLTGCVVSALIVLQVTATVPFVACLLHCLPCVAPCLNHSLMLLVCFYSLISRLYLASLFSSSVCNYPLPSSLSLYLCHPYPSAPHLSRFLLFPCLPLISARSCFPVLSSSPPLPSTFFSLSLSTLLSSISCLPLSFPLSISSLSPSSSCTVS